MNTRQIGLPVSSRRRTHDTARDATGGPSACRGAIKSLRNLPDGAEYVAIAGQHTTGRGTLTTAHPRVGLESVVTGHDALGEAAAFGAVSGCRHR